ncbi:TPA: hypothetical protein HA318_01180 [Candidatus Micrarchaeota archaeon]|nr:hypothetical protein [Candidatus Micrarchaeota archaeon]
MAEEKHSRAFIAAPLIGAIIFLTAIVFTVNINKVDAAETKLIVGNAYHNRIVSLLELYRADLGVLFRESMGRLIETALTAPGWSLFNVPLSPNSHVETEHPFNAALPSLTQLNRFDSCGRVKEVIEAMICSDSSSDVGCGPNAAGECEDGCALGEGGGRCVPDAERAVDKQKYGLQEWVTNLKKSGQFEGVFFSPAGEIAGSDCNGAPCTRFDYFVNPRNDPACALAAGRPLDDPRCSYTRNCKNLIPFILFDCPNFAKNNAQPFRCCTKYNTRRGVVDLNLEPTYPVTLEDTCAEDGVMEGCEAGNFFVKISIANPQVFPYLPRLQASDGAGNEVRSGAIADSDFYLSVKYPIYRYMDASFRIYDRLAYGESGTAYPEREANIGWREGMPGESPGIVAGFFAGDPAGCLDEHGGGEVAGRIPPEADFAGAVDAGRAEAEIGAELGTDYSAQVSRAVSAAATPAIGSGLQVRFEDLVGGPLAGSAQFTCDISAAGCSEEGWQDVFAAHFGGSVQISTVGAGADARACAYVRRLPLISKIIDETAASRVSLTKANEYSWMADLRLYEDRGADPLGRR